MARIFELRQELWTTNALEKYGGVRRVEYIRPSTIKPCNIYVQRDDGKVVRMPAKSIYLTRRGAINAAIRIYNGKIDMLREHITEFTNRNSHLTQSQIDECEFVDIRKKKISEWQTVIQKVIA